MASVHEHLYQSGDLSVLLLPKFLRGIVEGAVAANANQRSDIQLQMDFDEVPLSIDSAIPLGLLVNELISNCLKHGLAKDRPGAIQISGRLVPGAVRIVVQDNGKGLPDNFNAYHHTSMGLKLVENLARRLGGKVEYSSDHGCKVQTYLTGLCVQTGQHLSTQPLKETYPELPLYESKSVPRPEVAPQA
jgi:two-component sensor histidine kinase